MEANRPIGANREIVTIIMNRQFNSKYVITYLMNSYRMSYIFCEIGCMFGERLFACMRTWVHVCGIGCVYAETFVCMYVDFGCMSIKRLGACMRNWVHVC